MRLFITSYQKSGTHQIMPIFLPRIPDVVDRSWQDWVDIPKRYGLNREINQSGVEETVKNLLKFREKAFGHLSYLPEFAKVFDETDTKVLFNIRDPRDVIVAEYENAKRHYREGREGMPLYNFIDLEDNTHLFDKEDPITELIIIAHARWPKWLGWLDCDFVMPVRYENLRLNPLDAVTEIRQFLEGRWCYSEEIMISMAQPSSGNATFRRGVPGEWHEKFEPHHVELAEELLKDVIEGMGYIL